MFRTSISNRLLMTEGEGGDEESESDVRNNAEEDMQVEIGSVSTFRTSISNRLLMTEGEGNEPSSVGEQDEESESDVRNNAEEDKQVAAGGVEVARMLFQDEESYDMEVATVEESESDVRNNAEEDMQVATGGVEVAREDEESYDMEVAMTWMLLLLRKLGKTSWVTSCYIGITSFNGKLERHCNGMIRLRFSNSGKSKVDPIKVERRKSSRSSCHH